MFKKLIILVIIHLIINLIFASIYFMLGHKNFNGLDSNSNFFDYLYFSMTTSSSVGYGDISPNTIISKTFVMIHQMFILINLVSIIYNTSDNNNSISSSNITKSNNMIDESSSFETNDMQDLEMDKI